MFFASDNSSPVPPQVLEALTRANDGYAMPYGKDPLTAEVTAMIRDLFEAPDAAVYLVGTGTTANALALALLCPPWGAVYCHQHAHIEEDECGAPEFYIGGGKLRLLDGAHGKIDAGALRAALSASGRGDVHSAQPGALSITNVTEAGTVYSVAEVRALCDIAHAADLPCHMDGARFANALIATGATPAEMTWKAGIDVLSFGGTKNGLMGVEAVVIFDPAQAWELELRRKRGGHLVSKHRYLAAQMHAYLEDNLWLDLARKANAAASDLSAGLISAGAQLVHPTDANVVFAAWPRDGHRAAQAAGAAYYLWPDDPDPQGPGDTPLPARLVCSWSTTPQDIAAFLALLG